MTNFVQAAEDAASRQVEERHDAKKRLCACSNMKRVCGWASWGETSQTLNMLNLFILPCLTQLILLWSL